MSTATRILLVEDEGIIARDIQGILRKLGYAVAGHAISGEEAVYKAATLQPDLILMDIRLDGDMDGVEAARRIRLESGIPVIFVTAHSDPATLERAKITDPFGYVVKPLVERDLRMAIEIGLFRHHTEQKLVEHDRWMNAIVSNVGDGLIVTDERGSVRIFNAAADRLTGWPAAEAQGKPLDELFPLLDAAGHPLFQSPLIQVITEEVHREWTGNVFTRTQSGVLLAVDYTASAVRDESASLCGLVLVFRDMTEKRRLEAERDRLVKELQTALEQVKTLRGFVPVCSGCHKVRKDDGFWEQLEKFVQDRTEAKFSHTLCPPCLNRLYPEIAEAVIAKLPVRSGEGK